MTNLIEAGAPATWQGLEAAAARILAECGYEVEVQKNVPLARGDVTVDVWADEHTSPPNVIAVECKYWSTPVTKNVVHGFRTVVTDSGVNLGIVMSSGGFQDGAVEAAAYSNVRLASWTEFQGIFVERWHRCHMAPALSAEAGSLVEYTEPINSRIARKAAVLDPERRARFEELRTNYLGLAWGTVPFYLDAPGLTDAPAIPDLPLRDSVTEAMASVFPDAALDAVAERPLFEALADAYRAAIAEFDVIFGERA